MYLLTFISFNDSSSDLQVPTSNHVYTSPLDEAQDHVLFVTNNRKAFDNLDKVSHNKKIILDKIVLLIIFKSLLMN